MLTNYFREKDIVTILERFPDILVSNPAEVKSEVRLTDGKSIDLVIKDHTGEIYLIEVKLIPTPFAIGQIMEYKELFEKENPDKQTTGIVCAFGKLELTNLPDGVTYIDLNENLLFLSKIIDVLIEKLDNVSKTLNLPLNINLVNKEVKYYQTYTQNGEHWMEGVKQFFSERKITETKKNLFNTGMVTIWKIGRNATIKRIEELINGKYLNVKAGYKAEKLISINSI